MPDSTDPAYQPLIFEDLQEGELRVIAELVTVLGAAQRGPCNGCEDALPSISLSDSAPPGCQPARRWAVSAAKEADMDLRVSDEAEEYVAAFWQVTVAALDRILLARGMDAKDRESACAELVAAQAALFDRQAIAPFGAVGESVCPVLAFAELNARNRVSNVQMTDQRHTKHEHLAQSARGHYFDAHSKVVEPQVRDRPDVAWDDLD